MDYSTQLQEILEGTRYLLSDVKPSIWAEERRIMTSDVSPFPGKFSYDRTPYLRELVDCLSPDHPARVVFIKKGAQLGVSAGLIENGTGWVIDQQPCNILSITGHAELGDYAMKRVDQVIDSCGLRPLIKPNALRKKNQRTGDTNKSKEFPGGTLIMGTANHKTLRQISVMVGFIDDFDAIKKSSRGAGNTTELIEQRFAAYHLKRKTFYISSPELKTESNIEPGYLLGDQRKFHIPCPCCGDYIVLYWVVDEEGKRKGGITYELDEQGELIPGSVGYTCQSCGGFFTESRKDELLRMGEWRPTAKAKRPGYFSYHISSLYAPAGMFDWPHYVSKYLAANPPGQPQKEDLMKTFVNVVLGEPWEERGEAPKASQLMKNIRPYSINVVPENISIKDGNGEIVMLTCACDMNGTVEDARLDYEIVAWAESGASYSISHGSIGTFVPRENSIKNKTDRARWSYEEYKQNSVWPVLNEILNAKYTTDNGRQMKIAFSGIDCGHYTNYAYAFLDKTNAFVVGLKGNKIDKYTRYDANAPTFKRGLERDKLYMLQVNKLKDELASLMKLRWDAGNDDYQPAGFMNFPQPANGLYGFENYFEHYEAEHCIVEDGTDGERLAYKWVKKTSVSQNHLWDCRVYNMALRDIFAHVVCQQSKINTSWANCVEILLPKKK